MTCTDVRRMNVKVATPARPGSGRIVRGILLAVLLVLVAVMVSLYLHQANVEQQIEIQQTYREDMIAELERDEGTYDAQSIVLYNTSRAKAEELAEKLGASLRMTRDGSFATLTLPDGTTILDVCRDEENLAYLEQMSADYQVKISELSENEEEEQDDTRLPMRPTYSVGDTDYELQTYLDYMNMQNVWASYQGYGITIAVIDTGIDTDHPEFAGRISEYSYNATEDKIVKDYVLENGEYDWSLVEDEQGHGTAVTGVIAAAMDGAGTVGIAPNVTIITIKAECDENGSFKRTSDLVFGLYYAIERDVSVVNMSFGTSGTNPFADATQLAYDSDVICVAAAGNDATAALCWPAADPLVIGVGALADGSWELAEYSNYGENVNVVAPGTTYTTSMGGAYSNMTGTSLSCPAVTGAVALYLSQNVYQEFTTVTEVLYAASYDLGDLGCDWYYGYGALDVCALLLEERGTVTFNMMTDELENTKQLFIRDHTLQNIPEPERLYAVFDGWYYDPQCTEEYDLYADAFSSDLTLYANWVNEEDGLPYVYVELDDGTIEIRSYTGKRRYITIPEYIEGKPVTSIGRAAFAGNTRLRQVNLPNCLVTIHDSAFAGCSSLVNIVIPDTVRTIGAKAFYDNIRLSSVVFGADSALTSIGDMAFSGCAKLRSFTVPCGVSNLAESAFYRDNAILTFDVMKGNTHYAAVDGCLCNADKTRMICYPLGKKDAAVIPDSVTTLGTYAFRYASLSGIQSWGGVQTVEECAFYSAQIRGALVIPDQITSLGIGAFENNDYILTLQLGTGVTHIPAKAFKDCGSLRSIVFADNTVVIGAAAFERCTNLSTVQIPASVEKIDAQAFWECFGLQKVSFSENARLKTVGSSSFADTAITELRFPASLQVIGANAFTKAPITTVVFAQNGALTAIENRAFCDTLIEQITLPVTLEKLGDGAFENTLLLQVTIPENVSEFGGGVFADCDLLAAIEVSEENPHYDDIDGVVYTESKDEIIAYPSGKTDVSYNIRDGIKKVGTGSFKGAEYLQNVTVPDGTAIIGAAAFSGSNVETVLIGNGLTTIEDSAFSNAKQLRTVNLPMGLTSVGMYAFMGTESLLELVLPESLTVITTFSFTGCGTRSYSLPHTLTEIQSEAMSYNTNLGSLDIPNNVAKIGKYAFLGNSSMTSVTLTEDTAMSRIAFGSFAQCGLQSFRVPSKISSIAQGAFEGCDQLASVTFAQGSQLPAITAYMFDGCSNLQSITFEQGSALACIQAHGFEGMTNLTVVDFGDAPLTNIDNFAFRFCESLTEITIPEGVTNVGRFAFYDCTALGRVSLPASLEHIGRFAFLGATSVDLYFASSTLPAYLEEDWDYGIGGYYLGVSEVVTEGDWTYATLTDGGIAIIAYSGSQASLDLNSLDFGGDIVNIGGEAFAYSNVSQIVLPDTLVTIQSRAFYHSALRAISVPASVQFIGRSAFADTPLQTLHFDENAVLTVIEQSAFENTAELAGVDLPASVTTLGRAVFKNSGIVYVNFAPNTALTEIPEEAFAFTQLVSADIPNSVSLINHNAFRETADLKSIGFGAAKDLMIMSNAFYRSGLETLSIPANVTYIGEYAFVALSSLNAFEVDPDNPNYVAIDGVLMTDGGRKLVAMPAGRTGSYTVPLGVEEIGFGAFEESALSEIKFDPIANILSLGYRAFFRAERITSMHIPASVVAVDFYAFANCTSLQSVTFEQGSSLTGIYEGAFYGCSKLSDIMLPEGIVEISDFAFYGCSKLTQVPIAQGSELKGIYGYAMAYTGISGEFMPPETLTDIGEYAFMGTKITKIMISDANAQDLLIGIGAFEDCRNVTSVTLPFVGASFEDTKIGWFGYIFGAGDYRANETYVPKSLKEITVTGELTELGRGAFYHLTSVEEIHLPESVSVLGENAFEGTYARYTLTSPVLGRGANLYGSGAYTLNSSMFGKGFYGHLIIDDAVSKIASGAFRDLTGMTEVTIGQGITEIQHGTFWGCSQLAKIVIPDSVTKVDGWAFYNCIGLKELEIGAGVEDLNSAAFLGCSIVEFRISESNTHYQMIDGIIYDDPVTQIVYVSAKLPTKVTIPEGLTRIPASTFNSNSICEIVFPDSVEIIESSAVNCPNLHTITLGKGLISVEWYAFGYPEKLRVIYNNSNLPLSFDSGDELTGSATLIVSANGDRHYRDPESGYETIDTADGFRFSKSYGQYMLLSYMGDETFIVLPESIQGQTYTVNQFVSLAQEICITDGARLMDNFPFSGCTMLRSFTVTENCESYCTIDGVLYNEDLTQLLAVPQGLVGKITVPGSVETIPYRAFAQTTVTEVALSEGVKYITGEAFDQCRDLQYVSLPSTLVEIGRSAFAECDSLLEVEIPAGVCYIDEFTFYQCTSMETVILHEGLGAIGSVAFYECESLKNVNLPDGVVSIGSGAFMGCHKDFEISIPNTMQQMSNAFDSTATLVFSDGFIDVDGIVYNTKDMSIVYADHERITGKVEIPYGVAKIPTNVFTGTTVTEVIIPDSVHLIEASAFSMCTQLQRVELPGTLLTIQDETFRGCSSLTEIIIPEGVESIGSRAFYECTSLRNMVLPDSLRTLGYSVFYSCEALESLNLPAEFVRFEDGAFQGCSKLNLIATEEMKHYTVIDGIWYSKSMTAIVYIAPGLSGDVVIAEGVVNVGSTLLDQSKITSLTLPDSFSMEYPYSFSIEGCTSLQQIHVSESHPLYTSIDGVLYDKNVTKLLRVPIDFERLEIEEGVTTITNTAFATGSMRGLREIVLPSTLLEIYDKFMNIYGIEVIYNYSALPITCQSWDFGGIAANAKVVIDAQGNRQYADGVWEYDTLVTEDGFKFQRVNGVYTLTEYAGNSDTVTLPLSINGLPYTLSGFSGAQHVIIPDSWTEIPENAFVNSTSLVSVTIPNSVTRIGSNAFNGCSNLQSVTLCEGLERIESAAFSGCHSLQEPVFPSTLTYLGGHAYHGCKFESVYIPATIREFGGNVFYGCTSLSTVILEEGLDSLPGFSYCTSLSQIDIPDSVTSIAYRAFEGCIALTEIVIPDNVTSIGAAAFMDCTSLERITVGDRIKSIGAEAFLNTAYYNDPDHWEQGVLYLHNYLIRVSENVKYFELAENVTCIADGTYDNCYMLKIAYVSGQAFNLLETVTNIETLVIVDSMPTCIWYYFGWAVSDIPITLKNVVLTENIRMQSNVFGNEWEGWVTGLNIYAEHIKKDTMWDENYPGWQQGNRVYYGDAWNYVHFYDSQGMMLSKNLVQNAQIIRLPWMDDYMDSEYAYVFIGFDIDGDGAVEMVPATSTVDITAIAVYEALPVCEVMGHVSANAIIENVTEATCTMVGKFDKIVYCAACGEELSRETSVVDALGHDMGAWQQSVAPTCTVAGENRCDCTRCDHYETEVVASLGHSPADAIVENDTLPICTEMGGYDTVVYCTVCNAELSREHTEIPALGHAPGDWIVDAEPVIGVAGSKHKECTACGETLETEAIEALTEAPTTEAPTIEPPITEPGSEQGTAPETESDTDSEKSSGCNGTISASVALLALLSCFAVAWRPCKDN